MRERRRAAAVEDVRHRARACNTWGTSPIIAHTWMRSLIIAHTWMASLIIAHTRDTPLVITHTFMMSLIIAHVWGRSSALLTEVVISDKNFVRCIKSRSKKARGHCKDPEQPSLPLSPTKPSQNRHLGHTHTHSHTHTHTHTHTYTHDVFESMCHTDCRMKPKSTLHPSENVLDRTRTAQRQRTLRRSRVRDATPRATPTLWRQ